MQITKYASMEIGIRSINIKKNIHSMSLGKNTHIQIPKDGFPLTFFLMFLLSNTSSITNLATEKKKHFVQL